MKMGVQVVFFSPFHYFEHIFSNEFTESYGSSNFMF